MVVALYFATPSRFRWMLLLVASYYFYMCWSYKYILLIAFSTLIDYFAGKYMYVAKKKSIKKLLLFGSLFTNLGLLFFFKYFNFFAESLNYIIEGVDAQFESFNIFARVPYYHYLLPVGISFYTFQTLSYTLDVYKGEQVPEKHFGRFALFVSFFPQLVAGPIERSQKLIPQFRKVTTFDYERLKSGVMLMLWGFAKKVIIADRVAEYVNVIYNNPGDFYGMHIVIGSIFFAFQIYCDFSGYSDIAIGTARIMGYDLMTNFRRPYFADSVRDFWRRWHISLSTWFRDYVYIPLGGNRTSKSRWLTNVFLTFLISGLWHGANWTFVVWGALHGFYQLVEILIVGRQEPSKYPLKKVGKVILTFVLVVFAWMFFRANNIHDAFLLIGDMFKSAEGNLNLFKYSIDFKLSFIAIVLLLAVEYLNEYHDFIQKIRLRLPSYAKWAVFFFLILLIMLLGKWNESDFLYFQF